MRNPWWAVIRLDQMAESIPVPTTEGEKMSNLEMAQVSAITILHARAKKIAWLSSELAAALTEASGQVKAIANADLLTQEEARDFADGIFNQRSYR